MTAPLLSVEDLSVRFGTLEAVKGVSFTIDAGETVALVGESGSGKSVTALSVLKLLPYPLASHPSGTIRLEGKDLLSASEAELRAVRGNTVSMIFQEPMTSLNPVHSIERQLGEVLTLHKRLSGPARRERIIELLREVGIPNPEERLGAFPHQLSGGQRQRVMIAMALANEPRLLIADEPTTALDVTVQAQILALLKSLQARYGMALLFITHDLSIVRRIADRVCVMRRGEIVETGPTETVFSAPQHDYTRHLLAAQPQVVQRGEVTGGAVLVEAKGLKVWFPIRAGLMRRTVGHVRAVDGVDVTVRRGETLGIVGESGSGKSTLGLALLRLIASEGEIRFDGTVISGKSWSAMRPHRADMQIVFQDPYGSLSPRMSIADIVEEGLKVHARALSAEQRAERVVAALEAVGIDPASRDRYPHEFSGGQRQRVAIARAIVLEPKLIVLDEPTSALDVSIQAQVVDLLARLRAERGLTYIFISHDLRVVRALADRIVVMRQGRIVEQGPAAEVFEAPREPYTQQLLAAALDLKVVAGGAKT
jgi:microcin C transport system ATP-binding protein